LFAGSSRGVSANGGDQISVRIIGRHLCSTRPDQVQEDIMDGILGRGAIVEHSPSDAKEFISVLQVCPVDADVRVRWSRCDHVATTPHEPVVESR
jgi:hypothetical protein